MKKVSTLLLTGIMGTSMLFASFSGTATLESVLDLDSADLEFGMTNGTELDATFTLATDAGEAMGEGDVYAEITGSLSIDVEIDEAEDGAAWDGVTNDVSISVDSANIVGDGWKVSILGVNGPVDYAADTIALDDDDDAYNYSVNGADTAGVAVTLDEYGTVSLGYQNGKLKDLATTEVFASFEANELELDEGLTAQVGVSGYYDDVNAKELGVSAKVAYASDDMSASVAADLGKDGNGLGFDVVACAAVSALTIDAYYGTTNTGDFMQDGDEEADIAENDNMLNVQVVADLNEFEAPVVLTAKGLDLVNAKDLKLAADVTLSDELSTCVAGGFGIDSNDYNASVDVTYSVEDYTAAAGVSYSYTKATDSVAFGASASVESTTLVDGATLSLAWADGDDLANDVFGTITASCEIAF